MHLEPNLQKMHTCWIEIRASSPPGSISIKTWHNRHSFLMTSNVQVHQNTKKGRVTYLKDSMAWPSDRGQCQELNLLFIHGVHQISKSTILFSRFLEFRHSNMSVEVWNKKNLAQTRMTFSPLHISIISTVSGFSNHRFFTLSLGGQICQVINPVRVCTCQQLAVIEVILQGYHEKVVEICLFSCIHTCPYTSHIIHAYTHTLMLHTYIHSYTLTHTHL